MNKDLNQIIDKFYPNLSLKARGQIEALCNEFSVSAGSAFIKIDKRDEFEYFLINGIARSYLNNEHGEPITLMFFDKLDIITPHVIRSNNNWSLINFEAISNSLFLRIQAHEFEKLIEENIEIREFANTVLRHELKLKTQKEINLVSLTSKEGLEQFRQQFEMLENRVPHHMIASYLGITNVSLSRLRKHP